MKTKKILIAALLACAFTPALADEMGFADEPRLEPRIERRIVTRTGEDVQVQVGGMGGMSDMAGLRALEALGGHGTVIHLGQGRLVKNAPYSAEMVTERIQTLADGNQIVNKTSAMSYRDSAGRTRTEVRSADGEVRSVTIHDPVEGARYVLRPRDKSAIKIAAPSATALAAREQARTQAAEARAAAAEARVAGAEARLAAQQAREQARAKIEELRKEGKLPEGVHERVIVKQVERSGHGEKDVQIRIAQVAPGLAASRLGPVLAGAIGEHKWAAKAETKDLGTREFNGVKAIGTQRSYEIPAGEIGNRSPIVVSTETWTSPELGVVYQKRSDPRAGDTVFRLEGLTRGEPAAALFAVPSDYTVKDPVSVARTRAEKKTQ